MAKEFDLSRIRPFWTDEEMEEAREFARAGREKEFWRRLEERPVARLWVRLVLAVRRCLRLRGVR
jgi:hypothetical protein